MRRVLKNICRLFSLFFLWLKVMGGMEMCQQIGYDITAAAHKDEVGFPGVGEGGLVGFGHGGVGAAFEVQLPG